MNAPFALPSLDAITRRMVPRYTSYPTAPHFSDAVTGETYAGWLDAIATRGEAVSLYIHIPFCRSICTYCGCTTRAARRDAPILAYAETLRREIALLAARLGPVAVSHIHWGGGTPNILPSAAMEAILADLAGHFSLAADLEHAMELDPRHVTEAGARALAAAGVNRASLGVQTLDPAVQEAIARVQPLAVVEASMAALRDAGIGAINVDLMYGLPLQTEASIVETAEAMLRLRPGRFASFGYAHVPWMKRHQMLIDEATLPDGAARLRQAALMRERLEAGGYQEIGIDHFALPEDPLAIAARTGGLRRNFQGYTDDDAATLIGIGASSISRTPSGYAQNAPDEHGWRRAVEAGRLPIVRGKAFASDDVLRAAIIERLLCDFSVDLDRLAAEHGMADMDFTAERARLAPLAAAGWLTIAEGRVAIRAHHHALARVVAAEFDAYLGRGGRHSVAV